MTRALTVEKGKRLPHDYVSVKENETPLYASVEAIRSGEVERQLERKMTLVVDRSVTVDGAAYIKTQAGKFVARDDVFWGGHGSTWKGVWIDGTRAGLSFGWITPAKAKVHDSVDGSVIATIERRERVPIFEEKKQGRQRWVRIGPDAWIKSSDINEVRFIDPPAGVLGDASKNFGTNQWFDVDTGEQVLVAYRGKDPVFATLISSGRSISTPLGNYPVWAKVASMTMANQGYEDNAYMVQGVPWVLLFQGHNAFHGAYWHDQFGVRKSHGCVNLSPFDARFIFEWTTLRLGQGWTGYLPTQLDSSPIIHVRDSSKRIAFVQERPIGPPDREEERLKLEEADLRRQEEAEEAAAQANRAAEALQNQLVPTIIPTAQPRSPANSDVTQQP